MGLTDTFAAGVQSAQVKGSDLLRKPVEITLKGVQQAGWNDVSGLKDFSLVLPVSYGQDVSGSGVFLLDTKYAALIAELMFENDPAELPNELSDLQIAMTDQPPKSKHRWFQYSLRTLLIAVTLAAGLLGAWRVYIEPYRRQRETMKLIGWQIYGGTCGRVAAMAAHVQDTQIQFCTECIRSQSYAQI